MPVEERPPLQWSDGENHSGRKENLFHHKPAIPPSSFGKKPCSLYQTRLHALHPPEKCLENRAKPALSHSLVGF